MSKIKNAVSELDRMNSGGISAVSKLERERVEIVNALSDKKLVQETLDWIFDENYDEKNVSPLAHLREKTV